MARLRSLLARKLQKVLTEGFPPPARVKLEDDDGIIGVITSAGFAGVDTIDRQNMIDKLIAAHLTRDEQRQVQVIVGVTPEEETGYLADVDSLG